MSSFERGYADVEGASLYYELTGEGPTLVLLHGFSFDTTIWDDQIDAFAQKYRVLRYDLRGFGKSKSSEVPYSHAEDLKELLDRLHVQDAYLVGLSLGGGAVINFVLMYPDMARAIVLIAPSLGGFRWSAHYASAQTSLREKVREKGLEVAREIWVRQVIVRYATHNNALAKRLRTMVKQYSGWHWAHPDLGRSMKPPAIERLGEIRIPALVLVGDEDAPDHLKIADALEQGVTGARKIVLPGIGHLLNLEAPGLFHQYVLEFLESAP